MTQGDGMPKGKTDPFAPSDTRPTRSDAILSRENRILFLNIRCEKNPD
nr:hypothetical protein [uncultured Bilophila sp.]